MLLRAMRLLRQSGLVMMLILAVGMPMGAAEDNSLEMSEATNFFQQLASHSHNPFIANLALENVEKLRQNRLVQGQVVIPLLEQSDSSLVVPTLLNERVMGTFIVDTGATYTVITPALARKLGVAISSETPRISIITANGHIQAPLVTLKTVTIGTLRVPDVKAVVQPLGTGDDPLLGGLLGMNFFKGMDITVKEDRLIVGVRRVSQASTD